MLIDIEKKGPRESGNHKLFEICVHRNCAQKLLHKNCMNFCNFHTVNACQIYHKRNREMIRKKRKEK